MEPTLMKINLPYEYILAEHNQRISSWKNTPRSIEETYWFLHDLKDDTRKHGPDIEKEDRTFSFHRLNMLSICKSP